MLLYNSQRNNFQSIRRAAARSASESLRHLTNDAQLRRHHNPHEKLIADFRLLAPGSLLALAPGPDPLPNNLPSRSRTLVFASRRNAPHLLAQRFSRCDATRHIFWRVASRRDARKRRVATFTRVAPRCVVMFDVLSSNFLTPYRTFFVLPYGTFSVL